MTRLLAACLVSLAVASLAACGGGGGGGAQPAASRPEAPSEQPVASQPAASQPEPEQPPSEVERQAAIEREINRIVRLNAAAEPQAPSQPGAASAFDTIKAPIARIIGDANKVYTQTRGLQDKDPELKIDNIIAPSQTHLAPGFDWERLETRRGVSFARATRCDALGGCNNPGDATTYTSTSDIGYLEYSVFFLNRSYSQINDPLTRHDWAYTTIPIVVGAASLSNPTIEGTWEGAMIGSYWDGASRAVLNERCGGNRCTPAQARAVGLGNLLTGDASISVSLGAGDAKVSVNFSNIIDSVTGEKHISAPETMSWTDIPLNDGHFDSPYPSLEQKKGLLGPYQSIRGSFYGPAHEEVVGRFYYEADKFDSQGIRGAFGAKKRDE